VWRDSAVQARVATGAELDRLAGALAEVAHGADESEGEGAIAWELCQLAYQRA
jgi:hypothetical protein